MDVGAAATCNRLYDALVAAGLLRYTDAHFHVGSEHTCLGRGDFTHSDCSDCTCEIIAHIEADGRVFVIMDNTGKLNEAGVARQVYGDEDT